MVIAVSSLMGVIISRYQENHLLIAHVEFYPELIKVLVDKEPVILQALSDNASSGISTRKNQSAVAAIMKIKGVSGAAVINTKGEIVSNSNINLSLKEIRLNQQFINALSDNIGYEYKINQGIYSLMLYIPIKSGNNVKGVMLLSEGGNHLKSIVHGSRFTIFLIIALCGLLLYLLLFYIFYHSYRKQSTINEHLRQTQDVTIFALGYQAELRDLETGKHIERTSAYVRILANELKQHEQYRSYVTDDYISDLIKSAPLHDIGKVAIPDSILLKPGKLTDEEYQIIQSHSVHGSDILEKAEERLSFPSFFKIAIQMSKYHHEKWNGTGYPSKLSGEDIPLSARIMSLADVYDALSTARPYKPAFSHEKCVNIIKEERGQSFDPDLVDIFLLKEREFEEISIQMKDV
jgi:HD-GYP domain-containing protein (c-di-GMP phosphodiesterase class II)